MTARDLKDVIGQKIVAVRRERGSDLSPLEMEPASIELENGVRLILVSCETDIEPFGTFVINRTAKHRKK